MDTSEEIKDIFIQNIRDKLYTLSEIKYTNMYSSCYEDPKPLVDEICNLNILFTSCFEFNYLKYIEKYVGYCSYTIDTSTITFELG